MVEFTENENIFEQNTFRERERKFLPLFPEALSEFRSDASPIEQFYLSNPIEPFSLRFREVMNREGTLLYTATLKDRGSLTDQGLDRLEVEVEISPELYDYYKDDAAPILHKLRYTAHPNIVIDYYEDGHIQIESENDSAMKAFSDEHNDMFIDVTGDRIVDNEWRAHTQYRRNHAGQEAFTVSPEISVEAAAETLAGMADTRSFAVGRICGRSGSGKSTIVRDLQQRLQAIGLESIVLSTDDYHRGASWLRKYNNGIEWTEWDHPVVYDTASLKADLARLQNGETIERRSIDFTVAEPVINGSLQPTPVILLEGIYAGSKEFEFVSQLRIDIPTPLATCIGRRLLRDIKERPQFANPANSFAYMLSQAEPMWRTQLDDSYKR